MKIFVALAAVSALAFVSCKPRSFNSDASAKGSGGDLPYPEDGNFLRNTWVAWTVVDPTGLNCRFDNGMRVDTLPETRDFNALANKITLLTGQVLVGAQGNVGVIARNGDGNSWLMVKMAGDQICVVRANTKYIEPISYDRATPPAPEANGDYLRTPWTEWAVSDTTPLNCHFNPGMTVDNLPEADFNNLKSVTPIGVGKKISGATGNMGVIARNTDSRPWLMVRTGDTEICVVRANSKYVVPMRADAP